MKIYKLPSGNYNIRKTIEGTAYSITFDHKPNKLEIEKEIDKIKANSTSNHELTFGRAVEEYIEIKKNVLSTSTIVNYRSVVKNLSPSFVKMKIDKINSVVVQREINQYSIDRSPKTVRNASGLITAVMGMYAPDLKITIKLPQKIQKENYVPTDEEVALIIKDSEGSDYNLVYRLAVYGLRKSEMLAITADSLDGNLLTIDSALVVGLDKKYHTKTTKTESGTRKIYIDEELADDIRKKGYVYNGFPGNIIRDLHRRQDKYGLPHFRLHDFRVYFASMCHNKLGIPDATLMKMGGWKSQETMIKSYRRPMDETVIAAQQDVISHLALLKKSD